MHYEILDEKRRAILPAFVAFKKDFYLAGGTALALQIGHRDSIDFDFFTPDSFNTAELFKLVQAQEHGTIVKTQEIGNTLGVLIDGVIRISFMTYPYALSEVLIEDEYFKFASIMDIACMKLSAITSRATEKDYVDLYFILKQLSLSDVLRSAHTKFPELDQNLILKSLVYFNDITSEPIRFMAGHAVSLQEVETFLRSTVREFQSGSQK